MKKGRVKLLSAIFNNISVISSWSVLLEMKIGVPEENHWPAASHWQTCCMLYGVHLAWTGFELTMIVVIGTDCICSCKSSNHAIEKLLLLLFVLLVCGLHIKWTSSISYSRFQVILLYRWPAMVEINPDTECFFTLLTSYSMYPVSNY